MRCVMKQPLETIYAERQAILVIHQMSYVMVLQLEGRRLN